MFEINSRSAAIDNDFINHLAETRIEDDKLVCILGKLFSAVEMEAIMHPLVYDNELPKNNQRVMRLFQDEVVHRVDFSDITGDIDAKKQYYAFLVKNFYFELLGEEFPESDERIPYHWKARSSLGEIHTCAMCLLCGCLIFLSDDRDSRELARIIEQKNMCSIKVYNRKALIKDYKARNLGNDEENYISRDDLHALGHAIRS